ncbi:GH32 C-terminal domain-containing protein [Verrucomicrobia bacterium]|nr:GH32 C-terminal domain-containing protein [Verrucomicrobiota bacterium]
MIDWDDPIFTQIFLDDSSIEVFGNHGETVLSERIFPSPDNISIEYFPKGGDSKISSLRAWNLKSIWHP